MNDQNAKDYLPLVAALADGKLQSKGCGTPSPESAIHLRARQHSLQACCSWLLAWEQSCEYDARQARFCLERALLSAHNAENSLEAAKAMQNGRAA